MCFSICLYILLVSLLLTHYCCRLNDCTLVTPDVHHTGGKRNQCTLTFITLTIMSLRYSS